MIGCILGNVLPPVLEGRFTSQNQQRKAVIPSLELIGFSNCTMNHPWRVAMVEDNVAWATENWPEAEVITTDGDNDATKQLADLEDLIAREVDVILLSPLTEDACVTAVDKAMQAGIPVITIDRKVNTKMTAHIGPDNKLLGRADGEYLVKKFDGVCNIIEIEGTAGSSAEIDRAAGFHEAIDRHKGMVVIDSLDCDFTRDNAMNYMEDMLQKYSEGEIDAVYAHNDEMAWGALLAIEAAGRQDEGIVIVSIDGQNDVIELVKEGRIAQTGYYSTCAPDAMQLAKKILLGESYEELIVPEAAAINADNVDEWLGKGY